MNYITTRVEECAFEPESTEIRCVDCDKPTGVMGTCQDVGFCASCKQEFIDGALADGASRTEAERRYSEMLIGMIEGKGYHAKYARKRVLHFSVGGKPACRAKGGPHPLTTNRNESNCKRCLKMTQQSV
jgi:hypothetical protein